MHTASRSIIYIAATATIGTILSAACPSGKGKSDFYQLANTTNTLPSVLFSGRGIPEQSLNQPTTRVSTTHEPPLVGISPDISNHIYRDGDTIRLPGPHSGTVHISGWDLLVTSGHLQGGELLSFDIPTHHPEVIAFYVNRDGSPNFITNLFWLLSTISNPFPPGPFHVTTLPDSSPSGSRCQSENGIRHGLVRLNVTYTPNEFVSDANTIQASYLICVPYYDYTLPPSASSSQFIISEAELPPGRVLELQEMKSVFDSLFGPSAIFIPLALNPSHSSLGAYHNGEYIPTFVCETEGCGFIRISARMFTNPLYPFEPSMVSFHELSHFAFSHIPRQRRKQFKHLEREIRGLFGSESTAIYQIFTEATYLPLVQSYAGHPESNASELFASTATILRHFPKQLMSRYAQLPVDQRGIAGRVVSSLLDTVAEASGRAHSPPNTADLFPTFDLFRTEFPPLE